MKRSASLYFYFAILALIVAACNISSPSGPPPSGGETEADNLQGTDAPAAPENPTAVAGMVEVSETDPCRLVTKESAEAAMGGPVDEPIVATDATISSCTYIAVPGEKMTIATVWVGDHAKNYLIDEAAQLRDGCNLSYTASTNPEQPTPFPPDLEVLKGESILELFVQDLEAQKGCGGSYTQLSDLGENAYTFQSIFVGAVIGVATNDALYNFVVGDTSMNPDQALEAAKGLVLRAAQQ